MILLYLFPPLLVCTDTAATPAHRCWPWRRRREWLVRGGSKISPDIALLSYTPSSSFKIEPLYLNWGRVRLVVLWKIEDMWLSCYWMRGSWKYLWLFCWVHSIWNLWRDLFCPLRIVGRPIKSTCWDWWWRSVCNRRIGFHRGKCREVLWWSRKFWNRQRSGYWGGSLTKWSRRNLLFCWNLWDRLRADLPLPQIYPVPSDVWMSALLLI